MTKEAKNLPAASLMTVTEVGVVGSMRDHFTLTAPIFGRFSRPLSVMFQRALAVNRIDCLASLRDLKRGAPSLGPLRVPLREAKKLRYAASASRRDCWSTTAETSPSQDRSAVRLASVINRVDSSPALGKGCWALRASSRARTASLNTTRAHPNAFASALCWPVSGYNLKAYLSCMTITIHTWVMGEMQKIRTGRHCAFVMHVHLVFVTRFRHKVFTDAHLRRMEEIMRSVCTDFECELVEFNGENNHVHQLVNFPPKVAVTKLVNSLKGVSSRRLRQEFPDLARHYWRANKLWSGSYFAGTVGGAPLTVVKQYIERQNRPV